MIQFLCDSEGGKITPLLASKRKLFNDILDDLQNEGRTFVVEIKVHYKKVNDRQLGLYKALIVKSSEHAGMTFSEMEEELYLRNGYYNYRTNMDNQVFRELIKVENMNTIMFNNYTLACKVFVNEFFGFSF